MNVQESASIRTGSSFPGARDALLIAVLFLVNTLLFSDFIGRFDDLVTEPGLWLILLYGLAGLIPLGWRHHVPMTVFVIECLHAMGILLMPPFYVPVVGLPVALYAVARNYSTKISLATVPIAFIPGAVDATAVLRTRPYSPQLIPVLIVNAGVFFILAVGAWSLGRWAQIGQLRVHQLEQARETAEREAVAKERANIARELHDVISHAVTVMVLQAAAATRVAEIETQQIKDSLVNIETTGKQAMAELRRLLGVLETSTTGVDIHQLGPQPRLADLKVLLSSVRASGMPVSIDVEGQPIDLDPSVDRAAYRILQEGLTNALKHAGTNARAHIRLVWEDQVLLIQIDSDGTSLTPKRGKLLS
ncbi:MAG: sensor histidine kinase, partial [Pseudonocardiaceae bacterium]